MNLLPRCWGGMLFQTWTPEWKIVFRYLVNPRPRFKSCAGIMLEYAPERHYVYDDDAATTTNYDDLFN